MIARVIRILATALAILTASLMVAATPSAAHSSEAASTPEDGEVIATAPRLVEVRFDSPLLEIGAAMVVRDADGASVVIGVPRVERQRISVDVDPSAPPGEYTVAYRVVAEDGHALESSFDYTVTGDQQAPAASERAPEPASAPAPAPDSVPSFLLIAGGVLVLLLAGAGALALRR